MIVLIGNDGETRTPEEKALAQKYWSNAKMEQYDGT